MTDATKLPPLPEPFDYCYEWDGPYGTRKFSTASHNGRKPERSVPLFNADQMHACAEAARAPLLAEIEALRKRAEDALVEADDLRAELDTARNEPWPEWSDKCLKMIREESGYDGYDDADMGVDLPEELSEMICELKKETRRAEKRAEDAERDAARYRFVRHEHEIINPLCSLLWKKNSDRSVGDWVHTADIDAAIDAAIKGSAAA